MGSHLESNSNLSNKGKDTNTKRRRYNVLIVSSILVLASIVDLVLLLKDKSEQAKIPLGNSGIDIFNISILLIAVLSISNGMTSKLLTSNTTRAKVALNILLVISVILAGIIITELVLVLK